MDEQAQQIIQDLKNTPINDLWLEVYTFCGDEYLLLRKAIMRQLTGNSMDNTRCGCQEIVNEILTRRSE